MKWVLVVIMALVVATGIGKADIVNVDFSTAPTTDLAAPVHFAGITFQYDPAGGSSSAFIGTTGILGGTGSCTDPDSGLTFACPGVLSLVFDVPVVELQFDFSVLGVPPPISPGVTAAFAPLGSLSADATLSNSFGNAAGTFHYPGPAVTQASLIFSTAGSGFSIDTLQYTVPEADILVQLGTLMLGLGGVTFWRRRA